MRVPPDLRAALRKNTAAAQFFATRKGRNRYAVLYRIGDARRAATRERRIEQFVTMFEQGKTLY